MAIDIDQSYYRTGTATVAANGTTVTGQGTSWVSSVRAGDLFGTHVGAGVRIATVNSNTSLTLAYPWKGAAQTTAAYEVQFTPYDTGYYPAVRQLLQTMASGNIESFASINGATTTLPYFSGSGVVSGVAGAANTMPYFTSVNGMDSTPLTPYARGLLARTTAAQIYGDLGIIPNAQLPGRLRESALTATNANDATLNGWYVISGSSPNAPPIGLSFIQTFVQNPTFMTQIAYARDNARMASRSMNGGVWSAWVEISGGLANSNGWSRQPDGIITQWGTAIVTLNSSLAANITLPTNFPTQQFPGALLTNGDWGASAQRGAQLVVVNFTNSTIQIAANGAAASTIRVNFQVRGN